MSNMLRKLRRSPNAEHYDVKRDSTGTVQMTAAASSVTNTVNNTANDTVATERAGTQPSELVAFTSATVQVQSGNIATANTPIHATILRNGSALTSGTHTNAAANFTLSTSSTLTTPESNPTWTFQGDVDGGTVTFTHTASREDRWV